MKGWLRLTRWTKWHYFVNGRALCGQGVIPLNFYWFRNPHHTQRCKRCSALR